MITYFKDLKTVESVTFPECIHISKSMLDGTSVSFLPYMPWHKIKIISLQLTAFEMIFHFCNNHTLQLFSVMNVSLIYFSDIHEHNR